MTKDDLRGDERIDSRDVIARIEELESDLECAADEASAKLEPDTKFDPEVWAKQNFPDWEELEALRDLRDEACASPDWTYGELLIREDCFEDYARELAEDIGACDPDAPWPISCIDWEEAAKQLKYDYFAVTFGSDDYLIRN